MTVRALVLAVKPFHQLRDAAIGIGNPELVGLAKITQIGTEPEFGDASVVAVRLQREGRLRAGQRV